MKFSRIRKGLVLGIAASALGLGCELIVDFDRTKIPVEGSDSAVPTGDGSVDATFDTSVPGDAADAADSADSADASVDAFDAADADSG
jgi:hypothetical protein